MSKALQRTSLADFSKAEFLEFVRMIADGELETEQEDDACVRHFARLVAPHPRGPDLIFWPDAGTDDTPEGIVSEIERFMKEKGLPGFRAE